MRIRRPLFDGFIIRQFVRNLKKRLYLKIGLKSDKMVIIIPNSKITLILRTVVLFRFRTTSTYLARLSYWT